MYRICTPWVICISASVCLGLAQKTPTDSDSSQTLSIVVIDKSGKPVSGLEERDFAVLDNKHPQKITSFEAVQSSSANQEPPVEVILLMDNVNTAITNVSFERQEVEKFLERDHGALSHPVLLGFFSDAGLKLTQPSRDGKALVAELNANQASLRTVNRDAGVYGAGERLEMSVDAVEKVIGMEGAKPGRKLLVWISPGWPILTGPDIQLSTKDQRGIFYNILALSNGLRQANMTMTSIDPLGTADTGGGRTFFWQQFDKGAKKADNSQFGDLALEVLAFQSGGRVLNSSNDVVGEIAAAVSDLDFYYVLKFQTAPADTANQYHSLEVKVDKPGLAAHTRTVYYAQP